MADLRESPLFWVKGKKSQKEEKVAAQASKTSHRPPPTYTNLGSRAGPAIDNYVLTTNYPYYWTGTELHFTFNSLENRYPLKIELHCIKIELNWIMLKYFRAITQTLNILMVVTVHTLLTLPLCWLMAYQSLDGNNTTSGPCSSTPLPLPPTPRTHFPLWSDYITGFEYILYVNVRKLSSTQHIHVAYGHSGKLGTLNVKENVFC